MWAVSAVSQSRVGAVETPARYARCRAQSAWCVTTANKDVCQARCVLITISAHGGFRHVTESPAGSPHSTRASIDAVN